MNRNVACALAGLFFLLGAMFVHPDIYGNIGTYGVSVGTDSHYASVDVVHGHLEVSAQ